MSTTARKAWLSLLRSIGVKHFRATSGLGQSYICHIGDFAGEVAFIDRRYSVAELALMSSWCCALEQPVIFDIGANNGFIATQLAQLLKDRAPRIYAFEPVSSTFAQLASAVEALRLEDSVVPVCCAISDSGGVTSLSYNPRESLFAQVRNDNLNARVGKEKLIAATITVDEIVACLRTKPALLKIDVEGFEPRVLAGAQQLLSGEDRPAICFEWNPLTLAEVGAAPEAMVRGLTSYNLFYIDDFEGQRLPFGHPIDSLLALEHVCNVFAVPTRESAEANWSRAILAARAATDSPRAQL